MALSEPPYSHNERLIRFGICVLVGLIVWHLPIPTGVSPEGWHLLAVFLATIASFLLNPFPMGPCVLFAITVLAATGVMDFETALSGYSHKVVWLIVAAFFISSAVEFTQLGRRIALTMMRSLGSSTLGMGYAVTFAELILAPFIPSNTARGGGLMSPIIASFSRTMDSHPEVQPERVGSYLVLTAVHANLFTSAMFLTAMAANPLVVAAAAEVFGVDFTWGLWALGAVVPGLIGLLLLPLLMYLLSPPDLKESYDAQRRATLDLKEMGPWTRNQKIMLGVFVMLLVLWSTSSLHGFSASLVAWFGVSIILITGTQPWRGMVSNGFAWDAVVWIGGLIMMASMLREYGIVAWAAGGLQVYTLGFNTVPMLVGLGVIYYYLMYGFSMLTGHITALLVAFFTILLGAGTPIILTVALFAYFSSLCASLTHYSTGSTVIYYGLNYVSAPKWLQVGFLVSIYHMVIWLGIGLPWWKFLGWW
ncbi:MAG: DASS family sodium-coupled anion symporter [Candidatus Peribacteraceae bacterium]|jgi:DASS family divalent anion:Na+ symporter|nr:DASS family sodium-coupled anion symporter [Candidatus Peribacteraceae bacterium]